MSEEYAKMKMPVEEIGRALACSDDESQSKVINSMAKELILICRDEDLSGMQMCAIAKSLDRNGKMFVRSLVEFVSIQERSEEGINK